MLLYFPRSRYDVFRNLRSILRAVATESIISFAKSPCAMPITLNVKTQGKSTSWSHIGPGPSPPALFPFPKLLGNPFIMTGLRLTVGLRGRPHRFEVPLSDVFGFLRTELFPGSNDEPVTKAAMIVMWRITRQQTCDEQPRKRLGDILICNFNFLLLAYVLFSEQKP